MSLYGLTTRLRLPSVMILACCAASVAHSPDLAAQDSSTPLNGGWIVLSDPRVDFWYHGLAVVAFGETEDTTMYDAAYRERVRQAKLDLGVYPSPLDGRAEKLKEEFEKDRAFDLLHFVPLYFPEATRERMLDALMAVAERRTRDSSIAGRDTRAGMRLLEARLREGGQRRWLREFVELLQSEWDLFYREFREQTAAGDADYLSVMRTRWDTQVAPAIADFLAEEQLDSGRIYVAPALGFEGRMFEGSAFQRTVHAMAVWAPAWNDPRASLFSTVREMCYSAAGNALRSVGGGGPGAITRAAVRCGSRLLEKSDPALADEYRSVYLRAAGVEEPVADPQATFAELYDVEPEVIDSLDVRLRIADDMDTDRAPPLTSWSVESRPQVDLWYHVLAVAAADEPGPLGMYSADYARRIREAKQELGIYPTRLDSIAGDLRSSIVGIGDSIARSNTHFIPLYFPRAEPRRMLEALRTVARGRVDRTAIGGRDVQLGMIIASRVYVSGSDRRTLRDIVDAAENEWDVFYRDYWERTNEELQPRYEAVQQLWDSLFAPPLEPYLVRRRLTAGLIFPSPPLGPEGRIIDDDEYVPTDQTVAVQVPLGTDSPNQTVYAFLKELCFLLIDDRDLAEFADNAQELEDLRRTAAVRCGSLILQFYAPTLAAPYRRAFLDAVGATEGYTVAAFERVYALEPEVFAILREQIRRR